MVSFPIFANDNGTALLFRQRAAEFAQLASSAASVVKGVRYRRMAQTCSALALEQDKRSAAPVNQQ